MRRSSFRFSRDSMNSRGSSKGMWISPPPRLWGQDFTFSLIRRAVMMARPKKRIGEKPARCPTSRGVSSPITTDFRFHIFAETASRRPRTFTALHASNREHAHEVIGVDLIDFGFPLQLPILEYRVDGPLDFRADHVADPGPLGVLRERHVYQVAEKLRRLGVLPTSQTLRAVTPIEVRNLLKLETCCF